MATQYFQKAIVIGRLGLSRRGGFERRFGILKVGEDDGILDLMAASDGNYF